MARIAAMAAVRDNVAFVIERKLPRAESPVGQAMRSSWLAY